MNQPKYLSFSAIKTFLANREEYYLKYLAPVRPPRLPQTEPMSVGSAFDAHIKSVVADVIWGKGKHDLAFDDLFEKQVESQNRDFARPAGEACIKAYRESGALADLLTEIALADSEPRFEFRVEGRLKHPGVVGGIPIVGYPDLYFILKTGMHVILDFKVNGFCAKSDTSPAQGFVKSRDGWKEGKPSRTHGKNHKNANPMIMDGIIIDAGGNLNEEWAQQLMLYGWLEGVELGDKLIGGIEQLSGKPGKQRISSHRTVIVPSMQFDYMLQIAYVWKQIQSGHIFDDLSKEDNNAKLAELEATYSNIDYSNPVNRFLNKHTR